MDSPCENYHLSLPVSTMKYEGISINLNFMNFRWKEWLLCIALFLPLIGSASPSASETSGSAAKSLLIINSYNENAPWSQHLIAPVLRQIAPMENVDVRVMNMDGTLIRNDSLYNKVESGLFERCRRKPDYLLLIGNMAFNLRDRIRKEWGDIPMILVGDMDFCAPRPYYFTGRPVNMTDEEMIPLASLREKYNFTFVEAPARYKETIDMMVRMLPQMKKLIFAADELYLNQRLDRLIQSYIASRYPELQYERLAGNEGNDNLLQEYLLRPDPAEGILFSTWFYDRKNLLGESTLVAGDFRLIASSTYPIFALRSTYISEGSGFIGGYFYDSENVRQKIALALHHLICLGESARDLPFSYSDRGFPQINYPQMEVCGISADQCPEDTVFLYKPPTFWQQYRWRIITVIILLLTIAVVYSIIYIAQRKRIALLNAHNILIQNMPVFYANGRVIFDADRKVKGMKLLHANTLFQSIFEKNKAEMGKDSVFYKEYILRFTELLFQGREHISFLYYFKQNETYYEIILCHSREKDKIDLFGMDVTARHQAEKALNETNKKLEMTLGVAHIIPWQWNLQTQTIVCEAGRTLNHLGFHRQSGSTDTTHIILAEEYFRKIHPDDRQRIKEIFDSLTSGQLHNVRTEFRIVSHVGGEKQRTDWIEVNVMVDQTDQQGHPLSLLGSLLLITARKQQEQALIEAREQARESDQLKSAFLANMSHEIRTPLNAIVGFSNLLCTTESEDEKKEFVSVIENNNQLLLQLISDILDLSKIEANTLEFNYQAVDLNELFRNVESVIRPRLQPGVILNMNLGAVECQIYTEQSRLSQVIINLLTNACKFTAQGSITFGYEIHGSELYVYVRDTGLGVSEENQKKIFERFAKLNGFIQGTGLGLSICQNIVQKMGGRIGMESEGENKGSCFWFTIPYQPQKLELPVEKPCVPQEIDRQDIVILIAEDNDSNYLLFKSILGKEYKLLHAWDGAEAVELYKKHRPNLIIMDINMPNMNGYEATSEIRKLSDKVPIIAITAYAYASDKTRIMESGFNGYVSKPIDTHKLKNEIRSTINKNFILM